MATNRDRSIESLLRRREGDVPQSTDQCVDAESLAAWMESGLTADARATVEKHAAGCLRCQALLASMARTEPHEEPRPWWRSVTAKWLVPIAAVATAFVVWTSVGREAVQRLPSQPSSPTASGNVPEPAATAPSAAAAVPPPASPDGFADKQSRQVAQTGDADARPRQEVDRLERRRQTGGSAGNQPKPSPSPLPNVSGVGGGIESPRPQTPTVADSAARAAAPSQPSPSPVTAPGPPLSGVQAPVAAPATASAADGKRTVVGGLPETVSVPRDVAQELAAGRAGAGGTNGIEIRSPDPTYRWRILPPAGIQRSTDGGTTWASVDPLSRGQRFQNGPTNVLTAGSSPSRDVCWIVGRAGSVLLSTDGATWQRRPFPESTDLTSVRATSATNAVVTAADGRQLITSDGGATWRVVK